MNSITYSQLKEQCETGDILLFNTRNKWYDFIIEKFTSSKYSHVGVILNSPFYLDDKLKIGLYLLESGKEEFPDAIDNEFIYGVQVVDLDQVTKGYITCDSDDNIQTKIKIGNLYYRKLKCKRDDKFYNICAESIKKVYDCPYDLLPQDWIKSQLHNYKGNQSKIQRLNTFWCSALASYLYVKLGFLSEDTPWTLIQPTQFSFYEGRELKLNENIKLEPEILVN
jgi:hypothetical protein